MSETAGVWQEVEISLAAAGDYANPYTDVEVWVELTGPDFAKRCYGFWDGGDVWRVRVLATAPGQWQWTSGASVDDTGLVGQSGEFTAEPWSDPELAANPNRRGIVRAGANGHALEYADGEPFFLMGDTWWAAPTFRYPWREGNVNGKKPRGPGPDWSFEDMVAYRKAQGFNSVAILACHPAWADDGRPAVIELDDAEKTCVRDAWGHPTTGSAKDMHNEGGRPFEFPGRVPGYEDVYPDVDRINPAYFRAMDRKIAYLCGQGFVPFLETLRRDASQCWMKFYDWPTSYTRYVQHVFARCQARNVILSPIHFDYMGHSIHPSHYNDAANAVIDRYGPPPFGNLLSANAAPSTLAHFGGPDEARWLTMHQIGNWREHGNYWYLTEIYRATPALPALNGEPFYSGLKLEGQLGAEPNSETDDRYVRSGMYGSFLSGGLAGHIYGAEGIWGANVEDAAKIKMWDAFQWNSANMVRPFLEFVFSQGSRYRELEPEAELLCHNKNNPETWSYDGWAYAARTPDRELFMLYFEKGCCRTTLRTAIADASYCARWFNPRTGEWTDAGELQANCVQRIELPDFPSDDDWAMTLTRVKK